jgi:hypothetical protein
MTNINNITNIGMSSMIQSAATGFQLQLDINTFKLGSSNAAFNPASTDVPGTIVYTGGSPQLTAQQTNDPNTILYCISLDSSIGTFQYGSVGLYLSTGQLFTYISLTDLTTKTADNLPSVAGDNKVYFMPVQVNRSVDAFTITVNNIPTTNLPYAATFDNLPPPGTAPFNCYIVASDNTLGGKASLVFTDNVNWYHLAGLDTNGTSKFATTIIADGVTQDYTLTHSLNTTDIMSKLYLYNVSTGTYSGLDTSVTTFGTTGLGYIPGGEVLPVTTNTAILNFQAVPPAGTTYRVIIIG